jgi:hypothetical protein
MDADGMSEIVEELRTAFAARLGVHGHDLAAVVRRAGRMVPRRHRAAAGVLVEAERMAANPRLARLVEPARVEAAARELRDWLASVNPRDRRMARIVGVTAGIAFNLLVLAGVIVAVLVWRGIV